LILGEWNENRKEKCRKKNAKRAVIRSDRELEDSVGGHPIASRAMPENIEARDVRAFRVFRTTCSLTANEAALILARFYMSPPANPGGMAKKETALESIIGLIPPSVCASTGILVNSSDP
jgi:hypothetical protein